MKGVHCPGQQASTGVDAFHRDQFALFLPITDHQALEGGRITSTFNTVYRVLHGLVPIGMGCRSGTRR